MIINVFTASSSSHYIFFDKHPPSPYRRHNQVPSVPSHLFSDYRVLIAEPVIRALIKGIRQEMRHLVFIQIHITGIALIILVIHIIRTGITACLPLYRFLLHPFSLHKIHLFVTVQPVGLSHLFLVAYLENIEFQIIRFLRCPQDRMIRRLGAVFHLAETLMYILCRLMDRLCEQLIGHKMRAGTGCQV